MHDYGGGALPCKPYIELEFELSATEFESFQSQVQHEPNGPDVDQTRKRLLQKMTIRLSHARTIKKKVELTREWTPFSDRPIDVRLEGRDAALRNKLSEWLGDHFKRHLTTMSGWRSLDKPVDDAVAVVRLLHQMQGPSTVDSDHLTVFDSVEAFFLKLTGLGEGQLRPTSDGQGLNVRYRGRYLPIQSFGDGVVHTLLMAFEFMRKSNHIFLVEEPETHLHPELIRQLVSEMSQDKNDNQFVLTTHSPILLNSANQNMVYCVQYDGDSSTITQCDTPIALRRVLDVLDVRLSDLIQSNCVIWVEGPSDRTFINHCLKLLEPELSEGHHYQIAHYGGKLLSHFTADDTNNQLTNLLTLCRHSAIVVDSDQRDSKGQANDTKIRIKQEIEAAGGVFWITAGREIENYLPDSVIQSVYASLITTQAVHPLVIGQFNKLDDVIATSYPSAQHGDTWKTDYANNKTRLMPLFTACITASDLTRYDLTARLQGLVSFIKQSNRAAI